MSVEDVVAREIAGDWVPNGASPDASGMVPLLMLSADAGYAMFAAHPPGYASRRSDGGGVWVAHEAIDGTLEIGLIETGASRGVWRVHRLMKDGTLETEQAGAWRRLDMSPVADGSPTPKVARTLDDVAAKAFGGSWTSSDAIDGGSLHMIILADRTYRTETSGIAGDQRTETGDGGWFAHESTDGVFELGFWEQPEGEGVPMILRPMSDGTLVQVGSGAVWRRE